MVAIMSSVIADGDLLTRVAVPIQSDSNSVGVNPACRIMLRNVPTAISRWRGTMAVRTESPSDLANLTWLPFWLTT